MRFILTLTLMFSFTSTVISQIRQDSLIKLQDSTVKKLRDFQTTVWQSDRGNAADSLRRQAIKFMDFAKKSRDTSQLKNIWEYFTKANLILKSNPAGEKAMTISHMNHDLDFKLKSAGEVPGWNLSPSANVFENVKVEVLVSINGVRQTTGQYTLYWSPFQDASQANIIIKNDPAGASETFSNPCKLNIKLPGTITFWLKESTTGKLFKSADELYYMTKASTSVDRNFVPFNK